MLALLWSVCGGHGVAGESIDTSSTDRRTTGQTSSATAMDALRFAKQAEAAAAAKDRERTITQLNEALEIALAVGTQTPGHRMAESIHALMEALAQTHQGPARGTRRYAIGHRLVESRRRNVGHRSFGIIVCSKLRSHGS